LEEEAASLKEDDLFFYLGDLALNTSYEYVKNFLGSLKCKTYIINGNHPAGVKQLYREAYTAAGYPAGGEFFPLKIAENVTHLGDNFLLDIDRHKFYCTHMAPMIWPDKDRNRHAVFGHSHGSLECANVGNSSFGKMIDVGVDNALKHNGTAFFSVEEIATILKEKEQNKLDHH